MSISLGLAAVPVLVVPSTAASTTAATTLADWSTRGYGGYGGARQPSWGSGDQGGSSTAGATVDSDPATAAESRGVVLIDTQLSYEGAAGAGTGIVLTSDGEILTNYHVVEGATAITVTVATTGTTYTATVVGHSTASDVALLQLSNASGLATATIDDDTGSTGEAVTAVGNAAGTGTLTAADGTVTDLGATITTASEGSVASETLDGLIETDADVVPGDSGGPLVDSVGEVVGIDTAASSGGEIDGYAIPIEDALTVVEAIRGQKSSSTVQIGSAAFLGVQLSGQQGAGGVPVAGVVADSAAADLGLEVGDTVTKFDMTAVGIATGLSAAVARHQPGDQVSVTWVDTTGTEHTSSATLTASPQA